MLAAGFAFVAHSLYGWRGVALAASVIAFGLLLQFNRTIRVMRVAAENPVARISNAVMFQAGLREGMSMLQVVRTTRTLGRRVDGGVDDWLWSDASGDAVRLHFERGRLTKWRLERAVPPADASVPGSASETSAEASPASSPSPSPDR